MDTEDALQPPVEPGSMYDPIRCGACKSALNTPGRETTSFLLLEQFTIPLVGCDTHTEQFRSLCGLASEESAELISHRPAGGLPCPGCRHAPYNPRQPIIQVGDGGLALLACSTHQSDILARFHAGQEVQHRLNSSIDAF